MGCMDALAIKYDNAIHQSIENEWNDAEMVTERVMMIVPSRGARKLPSQGPLISMRSWRVVGFVSSAWRTFSMSLCPPWADGESDPVAIAVSL